MKIIKNFIIVSLALASALAFFQPVLAEDNLDPWGGFQDNFEDTTGLGSRDPHAIASDVIRVLLGFLGIIAVIIILLGGFKWMTAGGNEDRTAEARKMIIAGIIGLIIILSAYAIARFILDALVNATT